MKQHELEVFVMRLVAVVQAIVEELPPEARARIEEKSGFPLPSARPGL